MDMKERMHQELLYLPDDEEIMEEQVRCQERLYDYNRTRPSQKEERNRLLLEMFAELGENCYVEPPLHANFGGKFVHFGKNIYANYNLTLVDDTHIYVGDGVLFGPNVILTTAGHPVDPELRKKNLQFNASIHIGKNCWIGAGAILLPGVSIGENSVIGAGSVVTKDIPANVVAVGNPCRVLRKIGEKDREFYFHEHRVEDCWR